MAVPPPSPASPATPLVRPPHPMRHASAEHPRSVRCLTHHSMSSSRPLVAVARRDDPRYAQACRAEGRASLLPLGTARRVQSHRAGVLERRVARARFRRERRSLRRSTEPALELRKNAAPPAASVVDSRGRLRRPTDLPPRSRPVRSTTSGGPGPAVNQQRSRAPFPPRPSARRGRRASAGTPRTRGIAPERPTPASSSP